MAARASAIAAAELTVAQSRRELHRALGRLHRRLSRPSSLAAAAAAGALLGLSLQHRGRTDAVVGMLAAALMRRALKQLLTRSAAQLLLRTNRA